MSHFWLALRALRRRPATTALAVGALALGIGVNAALFSVIRAVLLRPLPYPEPSRIVEVNVPDAVRMVLRPKPAFEPAGWLNQLHTLEPVAIVESGEINYAGGGTPARVAAAEVTPAFFSVIGVRPLGQALNSGDHDAVVVGNGFAQHLGGARAALGRRLRLNGRTFTVVGVMPPGVAFPDATRIWLLLPMPLSPAEDTLAAGVFSWETYGRLRPGATVAEAQVELAAIAARGPHDIEPQLGSARVTRWRSEQLEGVGRMLWLLLAASGLVLLIACVDVAHLQLARAVDRQRETAIRTALGAGRWRLLRHHLFESLLLALGGGAAGLALAWLCLPALRHFVPAQVPITGAVTVDGEVAVFAVAIALLCALICGCFPVAQAWSVDLRQAMAAGAGGESGRGWLAWVRSGLVVAEVALAMFLLAGSGLLLQSLARMMAQPVGFQPDHVLTARVELSEPRYRNPGQRQQFLQATLDHLRALPGVTHAAWTSALPMTHHAQFDLVTPKEPSPAAPSDCVLYSATVSPDYFRALGVPLLAGRAFNAGDRDGSPGTVILSRAAAGLLWPGQNPVGKYLSTAVTADQKPVWLTVVGEVGNVRIGLDPEKLAGMPPPNRALYFPLAQNEPNGVYLVARSRSLLPPASVRRAIQSVDAAEPVADFASEEARLQGMTDGPRFRTALLSLFAALALLLSGAGVFGALAYWASRRRAEIGVRMALGASRSAIVRLVLGQGLRLVLIGMALGVTGAVVAGRVLASFLFQVQPLDPPVLAGAALVMAAVATAAALVPARRAARLDPLTALRAE
ncbi:MAG: ADOP family duplicated permease [Terriglobales bacterium]